MTFCDDYFSINDILATNERISCKFQKVALKMGYLDSACDGDDIQLGAKLELPLWLAKGLHRKRHVTVDIPKIYKEGYREILQADATVVDLHKLGPDYYHFGSHLMSFEHVESEEIDKCLIQTFKDRFRRIIDASRNSRQADTGEFVSKLDEFEKKLFNIGQQSFKDFQQWQNRKIEAITTSSVIVNHRKRKRSDD